MQRAITVAALGYLSLASCSRINICDKDPGNEECVIIFSPSSGAMMRDKGTDSWLSINSVGGGRDCVPFLASLKQNERIKEPPITCVRIDDANGREVKISIPSAISKTYRIGAAELQLRSRLDMSLLHKLPLQWVLNPVPYAAQAPPLKSAAIAAQIPRAESLGMQDGILYVASSGYSGPTKYWTVDKYHYQSTPAAFNKLPMDYLRAVISLPADRLLLSVVEGMPEGSAYLSHKPDDSSQALTVCPVREAQLMPINCPSDTQKSLPTGTQAMVVSADRARIVRADAQGALSWGALPGPIGSAAWTPIAMTGSGVRLAMTDLNADGKSDVVAVWGGGSSSQQAVAYLATDAGYAQDVTVSQQLTQAIGSEAITALAAGDVDRDGYGDVVFAQKQKLVVLQSQLDKFEPVWSTTVDPETGKTQIDAIAVGRLEAGLADDKQLDIVTASNSGYDGMNNLTMYLHAFRPMP